MFAISKQKLCEICFWEIRNKESTFVKFNLNQICYLQLFLSKNKALYKYFFRITHTTYSSYNTLNITETTRKMKRYDRFITMFWSVYR